MLLQTQANLAEGSSVARCSFVTRFHGCKWLQQIVISSFIIFRLVKLIFTSHTETLTGN